MASRASDKFWIRIPPDWNHQQCPLQGKHCEVTLCTWPFLEKRGEASRKKKRWDKKREQM